MKYTSFLSVRVGWQTTLHLLFQQSKMYIQIGIYRFFSWFIHLFASKTDVKELFELWYWKYKKFFEGDFSNSHFEYFFTTAFKINKCFYANKRILDIGCGPRGSLEWALQSFRCECVGLDPLAEKYKVLNGGIHKMKYVKANAEKIPFDDSYFDIIASFNSLDHVNDLQSVIGEIKRTLKSGGIFILITDFHHYPTLCEPSAFGIELVEYLKQHFKLLDLSIYEKRNIGIYSCIRMAIPYDLSNTKKRNGVLMIKMKRI